MNENINKKNSLSRTRTCDLTVNSRALYQLSYEGSTTTQPPVTKSGKLFHSPFVK